MKAGNAASSGVGTVTPKGLYSAGGIISGEGEVIRKDGTRQKFTLTSNPLTQGQADYLNRKSEA